MVSSTRSCAALRERRLGRCGIAGRSLESEIAGAVGPDLRRAGCERGHGADHMRQRLPVDRDRLGGILGRGETIGDHEGDGVADMAHHVLGKDRIDRDLDVHVRQHAGRRQRPQFGNVGGNQHQPHARHRPHAVEIVETKTRMRVRRAQHHRVQRGFRRDVGYVTARAAQQDIILLARQRLPEPEFHRHCLAGSDCARRRAKCNAIQRETT